MEKIHLTKAEKIESNDVAKEMFSILKTDGSLEGVSVIAEDMLLPVWFNHRTEPKVTDLLHDAERLHWQDPDLPSLLSPYEGNSRYLAMVDPVREIAIHGFRTCFPLGRSTADKEVGMVGLPVVDDLILGAHLVNGYKEKVTRERLTNFYRDVKVPDSPEGIDFPAGASTIESTFRMFFPEVEEGARAKEYVLPPVLLGYLELSRRSTDLGVRVLLTYINEATQANLETYGIGFRSVMDDPKIPPVDKREDGTIYGRLDGYKAVAILWDENNKAVLRPAAEIIETSLDLTGEMFGDSIACRLEHSRPVVI